MACCENYVRCKLNFKASNLKKMPWDFFVNRVLKINTLKMPKNHFSTSSSHICGLNKLRPNVM